MRSYNFEWRRFETAHYLFVFEEDAHRYALELMKSTPVFRMVFCRVYDGKNTLVAEYCRKWQKKSSTIAVQNFINKFMLDAVYREQYFLSGKHISEIYNRDYMIHPECATQIKFLNHNEGNLCSKDFYDLKTYGNDRVSLMKKEQILSSYPDELIRYLMPQFPSKDNVVQVLRWYMRGLSLKNCIRKVRCDMEVEARKCCV